MGDRDRLIELLKKDNCPSPFFCDEKCKYANLKRCYEARTANYLITNGVIASPCKVGQQLWFVKNGKVKCSTVDRLVYEELLTDDIFTRIEGYGFSVLFEDVGTIVFLTREEAEKALERSKG